MVVKTNARSDDMDAGKAFFVCLMSVADYYCSWYGLQKGYILEGNVLMAGLFNIQPVIAFLFKIIVTIFFLLLLIWLQRFKAEWVKRGLNLVLIIYAGVMLLHAGCWLCFITET